MADRFEDERGVIQDLLGAMDGVTEIVTRAGAVRGNHVHNLTTQWTYVVSGRLLAAGATPVPPIGFPGPEHEWKRHAAIFPARSLIEEPAGYPHAWQALEDTVVLVFTRGPRTGEDYEKDTIKLHEPLLTTAPDICGNPDHPGRGLTTLECERKTRQLERGGGVGQWLLRVKADHRDQQLTVSSGIMDPTLFSDRSENHDPE